MSHSHRFTVPTPRRMLTLLAAALLLFTAAPAAAATWTVNSDGDQPDTVPGDGLCRTSVGTCTLRAAWEEAAYGDIITFAAAYEITVATPLVLQDLELTVQGLGDESTGTRVDGGGSTFVFVLLSPSYTGNVTRLVLKDLRVQNGRRNLTAGADTSIELQRCTVTSGGTTYDGGGLHAEGADVRIDNTVFSANNAGGRGGAIYYFGGDPHADTSLSIGNNSRIEGNTSGGDGGGISGHWLGVLAVGDSQVRDNTSLTGSGGGIDASMLVSIFRSTVAGNSAAADGGGIRMSSSRLKVVESTVSGNDAFLNGGGLYLTGNQSGYGPSLLTNSTLSGNTAGRSGGGVYLDTSDITYKGLDLANATITENVADANGGDDGNGGGVYRIGTYSTLQMKNTILAGNLDASDGTFPQIIRDCRATVASGGYNLIGTVQAGCTIEGVTDGNVTGTLSSPVDPQLGVLMDNGGPVLHHTWTHLPSSGSPAVDGGNPLGCTDWEDGAIGWDQRLEWRPAGSGCDIGSVESPHANPPELLVSLAGSGAGTVTSSPAGIDCPGDCSEGYTAGTTVTLTATPAAGDELVGFTGHADCADGVVTMDANVWCTATFEPIPQPAFSLTIQGEGSGSVLVMPQNYSVTTTFGDNVTEGETVTMTPNADSGSVFAGFGGHADCADGEVTMTADTHCTATFDLLGSFIFSDDFDDGTTDAWSSVQP